MDENMNKSDHKKPNHAEDQQMHRIEQIEEPL